MKHRTAIFALAIPAAFLLAACDDANMPDTARDGTQSAPAGQARTSPRDATPPASRDMARSTAPAPTAGAEQRPSAAADTGTAGNTADRGDGAISGASLTAAVKARLMSEPSLSAMSIDVDTTGPGTVTLSGEVKSANARQRAEELARATDGVRSVENRIVVRPA